MQNLHKATFATISTIAQSLGINHVKDQVATQISHDIRQNLVEILSTAVQIMQTTKSKKMKSSHINLALESYHLEPLFGYGESDHPKTFDLIKASCIDALDLYVYDDELIPIESLQKFENFVYPLDTKFDSFCLAVQGNPINTENDNQESESYEPNYPEKSEPKNIFVHQTVNRQNLETDFTMSSKHFITYELKLYYQTSKERLLLKNPIEKQKVLSYLSQQKCLETLVPYYIQFSRALMTNLKDFSKIDIAISIARALCQNDDISHKIYMEDFISIALTNIIAPKILQNDIPGQYYIRDSSAELLKILVDRFISDYPNCQPTLTEQLLVVLKNNKCNLGQRYGALVALQRFGLDTLSNFVLQILPSVFNDPSLLKSSHSKLSEQAARFYGAAINAVGSCIHSDSYAMTATSEADSPNWYVLPLKPKSLTSYRDVMDTFGSDLLPYYLDESALLSL